MPDELWYGAEAQLRLLEAARLATVGRIVPAVAHDLATPLASIALRAESLQGVIAGPQSPATQDKLARYIKAIGEEAERCKSLLAALQEFARRPDRTPGAVDVAAVCRTAIRLVQHEAMRVQVELRLELQEPLSQPIAQAAFVGQALVSLLLNAIEASPPGGSVTVAAAADTEFVLVSVADEGRGLAEQARQRLFQPLASTHAPERAAGLGLMACRAIAEACGGTLSFAAGAGAGCRAELRLPLRESKAGSAHGAIA